MSTHYKVKEKRVAGSTIKYIRVCHEFPIEGEVPKSFSIYGHTYRLVDEKQEREGKVTK